jgi:thiamine-monophosphate kinase
MVKKRLHKKAPRLSDVGEFRLIDRFRNRCAYVASEILQGIGDDTAAVRLKRGVTLFTTDMLLERVHFDCSYTTFYQLGYKALAVNISDIFAMGGLPRYFLVGIGIPALSTSADIDDLYSGMLKAAKKFRITVIGGDTSLSKGGLVISGTLIGEARKIVTRSGATIGDSIYVTGPLGDSAMGLVLLKKIRKKIPFEEGHRWRQKRTSHVSVSKSRLKLIKQHLMPEPVPLKSITKISSMIDVSDGLLRDLSHICEESKVGALIYADAIPMSRELKSTARQLGINPLSCALTGGEDYVLVFTAPSGIKTSAVRIGTIIKKGRFIVDAKGKKSPFKPGGYEHFR